MIRKSKTQIIYTFFLYTAGFLLFLEWIYPAVEVGETADLRLFLYYAIFCFLLSFVQIRWWITFPLKLIGLLVVIQKLFFAGSLFDPAWLHTFYAEMLVNSEALMQRDWYSFTNIFRSVLFLSLIWLMSYLIHYWFIETKRIFMFVLLTIVYLGLLDTFTTYDATYAMIRSFVLAFLSFALIQFMKEILDERITMSLVKRTFAWLIPLSLILLATTSIGIIAPKYGPQWDDPVPFLLGQKNKNESDDTMRKVGYGEDDTQLGGSFIQDDTPVFQVKSDQKEYWRIETKDIYTGKGWITSGDYDFEEIESSRIPWQTFLPSVVREDKKARVEFTGEVELDKIVYPYGTRDIQYSSASTMVTDEKFGVIQAESNQKAIALPGYDIAYEKPTFDISRLEKTTDASDQIDKQYTELPDDLPERITQLAEEVTEAYDNQYEKAKAIEQYFNQNGFVYQTEDIPIPEGEEDYVDQFLFETKAGYCDNYSTSMVVMLRSIDIPARWAKGFTGGERIPSNDGSPIYEVTNSNAHSWVEVYFPDIGWVPFEPTQGFENLSTFGQFMDEEDSEDNEVEIEEEEIEDEQEDQEIKEKEEKESKVNKKAENKTIGPLIIYLLSGAGMIGLLILVIYLYRTRHKRKINHLVKEYNKEMDAKTYEKVYHYLLVLLEEHGWKKETNQTLREFASQMDTHYNTKQISLLTRYYEQVLYNENTEAMKDKELIKIWEDVVRQIIEEKR